MLDAVAFKNRDRPVVAPHGQCDGDGAPRVFGAVADRLGEVDRIGGLVELAARHLENIGLVEGRDDDLGHGGVVWLRGG